MSTRPFFRSHTSNPYEKDFLLWLEEQTNALEEGDYSRLDVRNLADEIKDLGKSLKREVTSRLETLITHLIKLSVSSAEGPKAGWRATVREQRRQLERLFEDSPSLRRHDDEVFHRALTEAKSEAYFALVDFEPAKAKEYEAAIAAGWDLIDIEFVLERGSFWHITKVEEDRSTE